MGGKWRRPYVNDEGVLVKECSSCLIHKEVSEFNLYDPKRNPNLLRAVCKYCQMGRQRAWRGANPDRCQTYSRESRSAEWNDPRKRLDKKLGSGISNFLARDWPCRPVFETLGFTSAELRTHLESRFVGRMSWENYGRFGWHVEHQRPLASFTYQTAEDAEFAAAWSLDNLRPTWWHENLWKGARYTAANDNEQSLNSRGLPIDNRVAA